MSETISISREGVFELAGRTYRIPAGLPLREVVSYRALIEPSQDLPGVRALNAEQRKEWRRFLLWRAVACVIQSFRETAPKSLSLSELESIHEWIARYRPELFAN